MEAAYSFDIMRRYGRKSEGSAAATKSYNTPLTVSSMVTMDGQPVVKLYSGPGLDATAKQDSDGNDILHTVSTDPNGSPVYTPISADQLKRADQNQTATTAPPALDPNRPPVSTGAGVVPDKDAAAMAAAAREAGISLMPSQAVADPKTQPPAALAETRQTEEFAGLTNEEIEVIKNLRKNRYDPTSAPEGSPRKSREIPDDAESLKAPPPNVVEESMYEEDETPPAPKGGIPVDDASPVGSPRPGGKFEIRMKGGSKMEGLYIIQNGYYVPAGDLM